MAIRLTVRLGVLEVETLGIQGNTCKDTLQKVLDATKITVTKEEPTDDYYAGTDASQQVDTKGS